MTLQVQNKIITIKMLAPPYLLISINTLHVVLCMVYALSTNITVSLVWVIYRCNCNCITVYNKRACRDGVINCGLSLRPLHYCNSGTCIWPTTCLHSWNTSMWNNLQEELKNNSVLQDVLCHQDYEKHAVAIFSHQI